MTVLAAIYIVGCVMIVGGLAGNRGSIGGTGWAITLLATVLSGLALAFVSL